MQGEKLIDVNNRMISWFLRLRRESIRRENLVFLKQIM